MALFGAPLAHEDHAQRACLAAPAMRDAIVNAEDPTIEIRIGLHSGDVLVRTIQNDLSMDYDAIGATVHLAGRMEQIAEPGSIFITAATQALAEGFVECRSLGAKTVKGVRRDVEVFELTGQSHLAARWQARSTRELSDFVGRGVEHQSLLSARSGRSPVAAN